jgi:hypothetical protein
VRGVLLTAGLVGLGILPATLCPRWVMLALFDSKFQQGSMVLGLLAVAMTMLATASVAAQYTLARAPWRAIAALALATLATLAAYAVHHASGLELAQSFMVGPIVLALALPVATLWGRRRDVSPAHSG